MRAILAAMIVAVAGLSAPGAAFPSGPPVDARLRDACEYGVTLALLGHAARAESVFVWLLGQSPGDPRALNNLGNLELLEGDPTVAISFYSRAAAGDSSDAGILLNQATASMLLGDEELARSRAAAGVQKAGSARAAGFLLGLHYEGGNDAAPKAASKAYLSKDELTELLRTTAGHVPRDSVAAATAPDSTMKAASKEAIQPPVWRSAGARAGDQDAAALVYWKR